ncbi:hypothetical protein ACJJTC_015347 [Scirpophaga incertulas]
MRTGEPIVCGIEAGLNKRRLCNASALGAAARFVACASLLIHLYVIKAVSKQFIALIKTRRRLDCYAYYIPAGKVDIGESAALAASLISRMNHYLKSAPVARVKEPVAQRSSWALPARRPPAPAQRRAD